VYVGFPAVTGEPPNQLKGFTKVAVRRGRRKKVRLVVDPASFATWSTADHAWEVTPGTYVVRVGTSSRELTAQASVVVP
jgi:beta-glucosidase